MELLDLYPKLRQEFYAELKAKEEQQFAHNTSTRVANILESTFKAESVNFNAINNKVIRKTLQALEESIQSTQVQEGCLQQAIRQLKNKDVKNKSANSDNQYKDPLTESVIQALRAEANEFQKLSEAQKNKLLMLTDAQKETIKALDQNLKDAYL